MDPRQPPSSPDAISLLSSDHREVAELFDRYAALVLRNADADERRSLAEELCTMLLVHARIEEEIFYPAAREALGAAELLDEAEIEHSIAKELIARIQRGDPADPRYDALVKVLGEYVRHHVDEEEERLFPSLLETRIDLDELGERLAQRQEELLSSDVRA